VSFFGDENTDKSASLGQIRRTGKNSAGTLKVRIPAVSISRLHAIKKAGQWTGFQSLLFFIE
jgi:hypothetical protein